MKKSLLVHAMSLLAVFLLFSFSMRAQSGSVGSVNNQYDVAVYYFPQWHPDEKNEKRVGRPWTEWETLQSAKPKFPGHEQPKVPLWGYEDEANPSVMSKKISVASSHGINIFLFDWYYSDKGPFLQRPLEEAFQKVDSGRMKFAIMWANHVAISPATFDSVMDICINRYFKDPNYWRLDGSPYFCLYQLYTFIEGFGSVEKAAAAMRKFREKTIAAGFKDLHLNAMQWGLHMPDSMAVRPANELIDLFHISSVDSYVWIHHTDMPHWPTTTYDYMMKKAIVYWDSAYNGYKVPYHPNVTMGWDASPRCDPAKPWVKGVYPYYAVLVDNTPEKFKKALLAARKFLDAKNPAHKILTINSWNEWTEGSYVEPDTKNQLKYLDAIKEVFHPNTGQPAKTITGQQWRVVEITFTSAKLYVHPFEDLELNATFTGPNGKTITRPAFWDGGSTWKIRFAPPAVGNWTMVTSCSDPGNKKLQGITQTIQCVPYDGTMDIYKHGFLKESQDKRYFVYDDGTPFFYLGDTHWIYIHERFNSSNRPGIASQFKYIVDKRVQQGFTVYQTEAIQHQHGQNSTAGGGRHDSSDEEPFCNFRDGFDDKDIPGLKNIDRKFQYIADQGLVNANSAICWALDPAEYPIYTELYMSRLGRYWSARYGAYPVLWTIAQEIDKNMYRKYDSTTINKWFAVGSAISASDSYHHPLTAHMENTSATMASDSWWDKKPYHDWWAIQWQDWLNSDITKVAKDFWFHHPAKPSVMYESPYEDFWTDAKGARGVGYMAFQSGIYGYGYGANGIWNDLYSKDPPDYGTDYEMPVRYMNWFDGANLPGANQLTWLKKFYTALPWWQLVPRYDDTAWAYFPDRGRSLIATKDQEIYVVYFSNRVHATGILKNMLPLNYSASWFNPRTGEYTFIGELRPVNGEWIVPSKPDSEDWVLLVQQKDKKILAGAIRWDAWIGNIGQNLADASSVGLQVERSLNPHKYHYRAPFYSKEISYDSIQCRGTTQAIMDQEIVYAKYAGIDYWALCWYPSHSGLDTARQLYLASKNNKDVKWCIILGTNPFDFNKDAKWLVDRFKEQTYQKVLNGRPLVYIFGATKSVSRLELDSLRSLTSAAGLPQPYIAVMEFSAQTTSAMQDTLGADALTAYISWTGKNGEPYYPVIPNADQNGWESYKATGKKVIPWVTTGHDTEPRLDHPVSWYTVPAGDWVADGTPDQIGQNIQNALNWIKKNPNVAETNAFIMYAWNEFDEGGWICPTIGNNTAILDGVKKVLTSPQNE